MQVSDAAAAAIPATELLPQAAARYEVQQHALIALLEALPPDQAPTAGVPVENPDGHLHAGSPLETYCCTERHCLGLQWHCKIHHEPLMIASMAPHQGHWASSQAMLC